MFSGDPSARSEATEDGVEHPLPRSEQGGKLLRRWAFACLSVRKYTTVYVQTYGRLNACKSARVRFNHKPLTMIEGDGEPAARFSGIIISTSNTTLIRDSMLFAYLLMMTVIRREGNFSPV